MKAVWTLFMVMGFIVSSALAQDAAAPDDKNPSDTSPAAAETKPEPDESAATAADGKPAEKPADAAPADATADLPAKTPEATPEGPSSPQEPDAAASALKTDKEKKSYAIGVSIGRGLKRDGADIDPALVGQGLADAFGGEAPQLTNEQIRDAVIAFQKSLKRPAVEQESAYESETDTARKFLEDNTKKEGVVTLPSGLQYRVIKEGDGPKPKSTDTVEVLYTGKLTDGTVFDSAVDREKPASFGVTGVIRGWTEALQLMNVGSKWELVIPSKLAYGKTPPLGSKILPGDVLVFEIELLGIKTPSPDEGN